MRAPVAEIFSSVQGEGPFVGVRQVFVRTYGCDLECRYCDTPASRSDTGPCRVESPAGSRAWHERANPLAAEETWAIVRRLDQPPGLHHSVSFTGGEPLLHPSFVAEVAQRCQEAGIGTYLETNGRRVEELREVIDRIDIVAMDVKLPSSQPAGPRALDEEWLGRSIEFLRVARQKRVFVKVIVTPEVMAEEVGSMAAALAEECPKLTLVLQPVTPRREAASSPTAAHMLELQAAAAQHLRDTRTIPQCHLLMGQL